MHGYLTRDGIAPADFRGQARDEVAAYASVSLRDVEVTRAAPAADGGFEISLADGRRERGRTLLLATGVVDDVPELDGLDDLFGVSVHHCPHCDGWEHRDQPLAAYGCDETAPSYALGLLPWSRDIVLCTDGRKLSTEERGGLTRHGIGIREERVTRLEGRDGKLERIVFESGPPLARAALFFCAGQRQHSALVEQIGVSLNQKGVVATWGAERTEVPGLWVAGDASKDAQLVVVAAAEGAAAAVSIHTWLLRADLT
jgi:thioredoxin reductase